MRLRRPGSGRETAASRPDPTGVTPAPSAHPIDPSTVAPGDRLTGIQLPVGRWRAIRELIGKVGHCTGGIEPGGDGRRDGSDLRGGSESYYAYSSDPNESIPKGARVIVLDQRAPRTIVVSRY